MANYTLSYTGDEIKNAISLLKNSIADQFSPASAYSAGDTVIRSGVLYTANTDMPASTWVAEYWDETTVVNNTDTYLVGDSTSS